MLEAEETSKASLVIQHAVGDTHEEERLLLEAPEDVLDDDAEGDDDAFSAFPCFETPWWRSTVAPYLPSFFTMYLAMFIVILIGGTNLLIVIVDIASLIVGVDVVD